MTEHISTAPVIVVRLPNWVGDVCMVLPSLQLLALTGAPLLICGKPFAKTLLQGLPHVGFVPLTGRAWRDSQTLRQTLKALRSKENASRVPTLRGLLYPDSLTSALTFWLSGVPSMGYRDDGRGLLLKWPVYKPSQRQHAVLKWYQLTCHAIQRWSLPLASPPPAQPAAYQFAPSATDIQQVQQALQTHQLSHKKWVLLAPTATGLHQGQIKVWPHYAELTRALVQRGLTVVTCPPEHERAQAQQAAPDALMLDPMSLAAFAYLTLQAQLVICNDSGVSHLAAIAGARQLTLFGVTDPQHTGPWSKQAQQLGMLGHWPDLDTVLTHCLSTLDKTHPESQPVETGVSQ